MWTPLKTFKPSLLYLIPLKILINLTWNWDSKPGIYRYRYRIGIGRYEKKPYRLFIGSADIENGIYRCLSVSADMKKSLSVVHCLKVCMYRIFWQFLIIISQSLQQYLLLQVKLCLQHKKVHESCFWYQLSWAKTKEVRGENDPSQDRLKLNALMTGETTP